MIEKLTCLLLSHFGMKQMSVWLLLRGYLSKSKSESLKPHVTGNVLEDWYIF